MTDTRRALGPTDTTLITVGAMVGSGIFATPTEVARIAGTPLRAMGVWIVGGAISLLGALCMAELGAALPATGGLYVYLRRAFGPLTAWLFGWAMLTVLVPSAAGFYAQVTAEHLAPALGLAPSVVAVVLIVLVAAVNILGVREAAALGSFTTVTRGVALAIVGIAAFGVRAPATISHLAVVPRGAVFAAIVPALWAYDGWIDVTSIAAEVRNPAREIPRSLVRGTLAVTALYLLVVAGYQHALGFDAVVHSAALGSDLGGRLAGEAGRRALAALVALSTFGGCVVAVLTGTRVVQAMGADGSFFRAMGTVSSRGTPANAVVATSVLAVGYVLVPGMSHLAEVFVVGAWPFYALGALATAVLRWREPDLPRPFRTPWHPWPVAVFVLATVGLLASYARTEPASVVRSLGIVAVGLPMYLLPRAVKAVIGSRHARGDRPR